MMAAGHWGDRRLRLLGYSSNEVRPHDFHDGCMGTQAGRGLVLGR